MNAAVAGRVRQLEAEREIRVGAAMLAAHRRAGQQDRAEALIARAVAVLAVALLGGHPREFCYGCGEKLPGHSRCCVRRTMRRSAPPAVRIPPVTPLQAAANAALLERELIAYERERGHHMHGQRGRQAA